MNLKNTVAIVTGGGSGIGLGIVEVLLKYGARVVIMDITSEVYHTVQDLKKLNYDVTGYQVDISNENAVCQAIQAMVKQYKKIDILINNASVKNHNPFIETKKEEFYHEIEINIMGTWMVTQAVVPYFINQKSGHIVNISSIIGTAYGKTNEVGYATTKAALIGFTKSLALELAPYSIHVNAICPGYVISTMTKEVAHLNNQENPKKVIQDIIAAIPMKRLATPYEIGEVVAFLVSNEASYMTGSIITVDGGTTLQ